MTDWLGLICKERPSFLGPEISDTPVICCLEDPDYLGITVEWALQLVRERALNQSLPVMYIRSARQLEEDPSWRQVSGRVVVLQLDDWPALKAGGRLQDHVVAALDGIQHQQFGILLCTSSMLALEDGTHAWKTAVLRPSLDTVQAAEVIGAFMGLGDWHPLVPDETVAAIYRRASAVAQEHMRADARLDPLCLTVLDTLLTRGQQEEHEEHFRLKRWVLRQLAIRLLLRFPGPDIPEILQRALRVEDSLPGGIRPDVQLVNDGQRICIEAETLHGQYPSHLHKIAETVEKYARARGGFTQVWIVFSAATALMHLPELLRLRKVLRDRYPHLPFEFGAVFAHVHGDWYRRWVKEETPMEALMPFTSLGAWTASLQ